MCALSAEIFPDNRNRYLFRFYTYSLENLSGYFFFHAREDLHTYFEAQETEDPFWAYLHQKEQHIPIFYRRTDTNLSVYPSILGDTICPKDSISHCESRSSSERLVNILRYRKKDYLYYWNGRDFIELKESANPIGQEGEILQAYGIRTFRIVTQDFTVFDIKD
jgi:hypothetical protein